jgi:DNA-binding FrmR family transcriptional regulator
MTEHGYVADKEALVKRLRRVEGQVRGVQKMVDEERYCIDILTQISAIQSAVDAVAVGLLNDHVRHCIAGSTGSDRDAKLDELMQAVGRLVKT